MSRLGNVPRGIFCYQSNSDSSEKLHQTTFNSFVIKKQDEIKCVDVADLGAATGCKKHFTFTCFCRCKACSCLLPLAVVLGPVSGWLVDCANRLVAVLLCLSDA